MPLTGENRPRTGRLSEGRSKLGTWWAGNTDEPAAKSRTVSASAISSESTFTPLRKSQTAGPDSRSSNPGAFSFIQSGMSALQKLTQQDGAGTSDELCDMNVEAALFPNGSEGEAFSPAAYKNLQMKATGLLTRFQTAYRSQAKVLREIQAEHSAEKDEFADASTKAKHLQLQLDKMTRKAREQEDNIMALLEQLTAEKKANMEYERIAKEKGIVLTLHGHSVEESVVTEDLAAESDQRRRKWMQSIAVDGRGVEEVDTDEESYEDGSVFSRSRSPTIAPSVFEGSIPEGSQSPTPVPGVPHASRPRSSISSQSQKALTPSPPRGPRPGTSQQHGWGLQKLIKVVSGETKAAAGKEEEKLPDECSNCRGQNASVAWDTVSLLRYENMELKNSVSVKDMNIDEALHIITRLQMR